MRAGCQTLFLGLFTAVGLLGAAAVAFDWLQGLDTHFWEESSCTIEASAVAERRQSGDWVFEVSYSYPFRGNVYRGQDYRHDYSGSESVADAQRLAARYAPGTSVPCWVDPDAPGSAYLAKAGLWRGLWIFGPLLFVAIGGGMLWFLHAPSRPPAPEETVVAAAGPDRKGALRGALLVGGFFGIFLVVGVGMLIPFFVWPALQVVEARSWSAVPCEIVSSGVRSHSSDDGTTYSVEAVYRYEIDGREILGNRYRFMGGSSSGYDSKQAAVDRIPAGSTVTCWVNPDDPFDAVVERGFTADYLFGLVPGLFALVGLGGIVFVVWGARSLRKEAGRPSWAPAGAARDFVRLAAGDGGAATAEGWAAETAAELPAGPLTLEPAMSRLGKLGCATAVALFWNGIVSVFLWQLVTEWRAGRPDWFLAVFLVPFVLIGLLLLSGIPYGVLALLNPRPRVHLSRGAVPAGGSVQIDWSFRGAGSRIRRLKLSLEAVKVITETEVHSRGASVSTRTEPLRTVEVLDRGAEHPLEFGSVSLTLPADAPPTSEGAGESVRWKLKLHGEIAYWPDVAEEYEIRVLPPDEYAGA